MALINSYSFQGVDIRGNNYYDTDDISDYTPDNSEREQIEVTRNMLLQNNLNGVFGLPYQFLEDVDPNLPDGAEIGTKYSEKILSKMNLLFLTPCRQVFMPGFSKETKEGWLRRQLDSGILGEIKDSGAMGEIFNSESGRYYTAEFAYGEYYRYVNVIAAMMCKYTNHHNTEISFPGMSPNTKLSDIDWHDFRNEGFDSYFAADHAVVFYLDGYVQCDESFGNDTSESSLANTINGFHDQANEIRFLLGKDSTLTQMVEATAEGFGELASGLGGTLGDFTGGMLGTLADKGVNTIVKGGKIIFPKIWSGSSWDRSSFTFTIKLRSPDHDSLSILLNILIPIAHALGLVWPIGMEDDPNGYTSPFLVKAYCKGMFNIDMGLVTNLTISKGAECQWNDDGLPTQVDLSITIEDLYNSIFMTPTTENGVIDSSWHIVHNTAMMDFLANMCGLNVAHNELVRQYKMFLFLVKDQFNAIPHNIWSDFSTWVAKTFAGLYK